MARPNSILLGLLLLFLPPTGCDGEGNARGEVGAGRPGSPVVLGTPLLREFADRIEALGTAKANESVVITARVTETVQRVTFRDGAHVEAGEVLVELTSTEESAQLDEARAQHADARQRYTRVVDLHRQGTESQSRLDEVTSQLDAARARLASLEARLSDRLITAPFSGVLGLRAVSPGTLVKPGDRITTLDDIEIVKLDFSVPETFLSSLRTGLVIQGRSAAYPERDFEGRVVAIDTRLDPQTRAAMVRAEIDNREQLLRPGMLLTVALRANPRRSLALPESALLPQASKQFALRVDDELQATRVEVTIGRRIPGYVEVLAGIEATDRVVIDGASKVRPGSTVRVVGREVTPPDA
jgi:membrane fusion protein (multidrug efflux system)